MNRTAFIRYFGWPEYKSIGGKNGKSFFVLTAIIFISLIAIGLGKSATQYLKIKMEDPFIKFVNVTKPTFTSVHIEDFDKDELKNRFSYGDVSQIILFYRDFMGSDGKEIDATISSISERSEFFNFLSSNSDVFLTGNNFNDNEFGCIVTKKYLEKLGYDKLEVDYINYVNDKNNKEILLPIPISGVVTQLPDYTDILISKKFYNYIHGYNCLDIENYNHKTYLQFYLPETKEIPAILDDMGYSKYAKDILLFNNGTIIKKYGIQNYNLERDSVLKQFPKSIQFYDYHQIACDTQIKSDPEHFTFSFNSLDSIKPFKEYLHKKHKLKIDMSTIEAKENFNFFNNLAKLLSFSLILFSVFSIYIFTTNLINNHIDKIKRNLGTLKAFGLGNNSVILIYTFISSVLVISAFTIAYLLSYLFGGIVLESLIDYSNISVDGSIDYINFKIIYLTMAFVVFPIISISLRIWSKLKKATPGDLIYER